MGLFKKKAKEPSEIEHLKGQIESMTARLEANDAAKQRLGEQVSGIVTRLDAPPEPAQPVVSPAEFSAVEAKLQAVIGRLAEPSAPAVDPGQFDDVRAQLQSVTDRLATRFEPPSEPVPQASAVDPEQFEAIGATVRAIAERIDGFDAVAAQVESITARIDRLDARITSISNELANQITELSGDIDGFTADDTPASEVVDHLRDTQTKLANEQARYQIAFRQDLAELANLLKRT